jgi:hypothetical protein
MCAYLVRQRQGTMELVRRVAAHLTPWFRIVSTDAELRGMVTSGLHCRHLAASTGLECVFCS